MVVTEAQRIIMIKDIYPRKVSRASRITNTITRCLVARVNRIWISINKIDEMTYTSMGSQVLKLLIMLMIVIIHGEVQLTTSATHIQGSIAKTNKILPTIPNTTKTLRTQPVS